MLIHAFHSLSLAPFPDLRSQMADIRNRHRSRSGGRRHKHRGQHNGGRQHHYNHNHHHHHNSVSSGSEDSESDSSSSDSDSGSASSSNSSLSSASKSSLSDFEDNMDGINDDQQQLLTNGHHTADDVPDVVVAVNGDHTKWPPMADCDDNVMQPLIGGPVNGLPIATNGNIANARQF